MVGRLTDGVLHEKRSCKFRVGIPLGQIEGLKVRCGVAFASEEGIHGALGDQTVGWFEIAGGA